MQFFFFEKAAELVGGVSVINGAYPVNFFFIKDLQLFVKFIFPIELYTDRYVIFPLK